MWGWSLVGAASRPGQEGRRAPELSRGCGAESGPGPEPPELHHDYSSGASHNPSFGLKTRAPTGQNSLSNSCTWIF